MFGDGPVGHDRRHLAPYAVRPVTCEPMLQEDGTPSGFEYCWREDRVRGRIDRVADVACTLSVIDPTAECFAASGDSQTCTTSADCGTGEICGAKYYGSCDCMPLCTGDATCATGQACSCAATIDAGYHTTDIHRCVEGECRTGADCPSGVCGVGQDC